MLASFAREMDLGSIALFSWSGSFLSYVFRSDHFTTKYAMSVIKTPSFVVKWMYSFPSHKNKWLQDRQIRDRDRVKKMPHIVDALLLMREAFFAFFVILCAGVNRGTPVTSTCGSLPVNLFYSYHHTLPDKSKSV